MSSQTKNVFNYESTAFFGPRVCRVCVRRRPQAQCRKDTYCDLRAYDIIILLLYYYVTLKQRIVAGSAGTEPGGPAVFFNEKSYNTTYYYINFIKIIPML